MALIDASLGEGGVEVEGVPCCVESVVWVHGFMGGDGAVEFLFADVALVMVSMKRGERMKGKEIPRNRRCLKQWRCCSWSWCGRWDGKPQ